MRRAFALAAAVGLIAAGIGCKHVAGVCDCATHPDNAVLPPITNPYPTVGGTVTGMPVMAAPEKAPAPAAGEKLMDKPAAPGK